MVGGSLPPGQIPPVYSIYYGLFRCGLARFGIVSFCRAPVYVMADNWGNNLMEVISFFFCLLITISGADPGVPQGCGPP